MSSPLALYARGHGSSTGWHHTSWPPSGGGHHWHRQASLAVERLVDIPAMEDPWRDNKDTYDVNGGRNGHMERQQDGSWEFYDQDGNHLGHSEPERI